MGLGEGAGWDPDEVGGDWHWTPKGSDTRGPSQRHLSAQPRSVAADQEFSDPESSSPALPSASEVHPISEGWALGPRVGVRSLALAWGPLGRVPGPEGLQEAEAAPDAWIEAGADTRNGWGGREPAAE